ncbi:MAG: flagellar basal body-associated FliL family protein [Geminicoccaceae bacterium]
MATSGEKTDEAPGRRGKGKLLLLGGLGLVLLLGGGGAAARFTGLLAGGDAATPPDVARAEGHGGEEAQDDVGGPPAVVFVDMPDLLVNLRSESPKLRYLKLRLSLEVQGEPTAEGVRRLMPRIMDSFQLYLRALSLEDVQGAAGMQRLKEELGARVNLAVAPARVGSVLLKEMLVQ